jgi:hypothetical protein
VDTVAPIILVESFSSKSALVARAQARHGCWGYPGQVEIRQAFEQAVWLYGRMVDPVTLIIVVAAGEAATPTDVAMVRAAREALGTRAVELRETKGAPTDDALLAIERQEQPNAVAELVWDAADHRRVTVRVHMVRTQRWLERSMTYMPSDPAAERGRTLGLAVASILPEIGTDGGASGPEPAATALAPASMTPSPPAAASAAAPATSPIPAAPATTTGLAPPIASASATPIVGSPSADAIATPPTVASRRPHVEIDFAASGASSIGGIPTIGVGIATQWFLARSVSLRLGASERSGSLDAAEASLFSFIAASGVAFHPWQSSSPHPIDVSLRADYLLVRQSVTHFDSDDPTPVTQARWLSGFDAFIDGGWLLSSDVAAVAGVGIEDVLAPTYVNVRETPVATIPPLRAVAELGFRLRL